VWSRENSISTKLDGIRWNYLDFFDRYLDFLKNVRTILTKARFFGKLANWQICFPEDRTLFIIENVSLKLDRSDYLSFKYSFMKKYLSLLLLLLPTIAFAHGVHGSGFMAGFTHPIFGIDHNVVLLGAGFLGYLLNQKQWYLYPLAFILLMAIGGFLGIGQEATVAIEKFIAFSAVLIGLAIGFRFQFNLLIGLGMMTLFGFAHGFAHGAEMPEDTTAFQYISGFVIGAALLALIGWGIGQLIHRQSNTQRWVTFLGGILAGAGLIFLI